MKKAEDAKVWKISLEGALEARTVEKALQEASEMLRESDLGEDIVELHRIDVKDQETIIFFSGEKALADRFTKTLQVYSPKAKIQCSEAKAKELLSLS
jgi:hypothetical protein